MGQHPPVVHLRVAVHEHVETAAAAPVLLGRLGVAGGASYDGLVALAARDHDATLATRDARAVGTYERVGTGWWWWTGRDAVRRRGRTPARR